MPFSTGGGDAQYASSWWDMLGLPKWLTSHDESWGGWGEILFWVLVMVAHGGLIVYAAWRLAVRHTEATGSSVMVPVKVKVDEAETSSFGTGFSLPTTRRRGGDGKQPAE